MKYVVGIDEVGRGSLAGPVCVCAVAIPERLYKKIAWKNEAVILTDSKKMTRQNRQWWFDYIKTKKDQWKIKKAVSYRSASFIDKYGITEAVKRCIQSALIKLTLAPEECIVFLDGGLYAPKHFRLQRTIIKGDVSHKLISLASVIAKVSRDRVMDRHGKKSPHYGWERNKGYGTAEHRKAIRRFGTTNLHRETFLKNIDKK